MSIFFSTHLYALGWELGIDEAGEEFKAQVNSPTQDSLPCVRTLTRLRKLDECGLWFDTGSTRIAHSRSRAFHDALESGCDVWLTCDDDIEADTRMLQAMLDAVRDQPNVCIGPCWSRRSRVHHEPRVPLTLPLVTNVRTLTTGAKLITASHAGLGITAIGRPALEAIAAANEEPRFIDDDGVSRRALFLERITPEGLWMGEDVSFFTRIPPSVSIEAVLTGHTVHQGDVLSLEQLAKWIDECKASQKPMQNPEPADLEK